MSSLPTGMESLQHQQAVQRTLARYQRKGCGATQQAMAEALVARERQWREHLAQQRVSAAEAVYGFATWLTTRPTVTQMSSVHDGAVVVALVRAFVTAQGLAPVRDNVYPHNLYPTPEPAA